MVLNIFHFSCASWFDNLHAYLFRCWSLIIYMPLCKQIYIYSCCFAFHVSYTLSRYYACLFTDISDTLHWHSCRFSQLFFKKQIRLCWPNVSFNTSFYLICFLCVLFFKYHRFDSINCWEAELFSLVYVETDLLLLSQIEYYEFKFKSLATFNKPMCFFFNAHVISSIADMICNFA